MNPFRIVAEIDQAKSIGCGLCYTSCEDGAHQSITRGSKDVRASG